MMYDFTVIGGGSAGLVAAKFAQGLGKKTAIIEKKMLGGDCTHTGCIPSKALLSSAHLAQHIKELKDYGLSMDTSTLDRSKVMSHVRQIVKSVYETETPEIFRQEGIDVIEGHAEFADSHTVIVNGKKITSEYFLIAAGSSPAIPPVSGLSEVDYHTNETVFSMDRLPVSVAVLGGGPIGAEMASAMNALGVDTAVIEMGDRILPLEDIELSELLRAHMQENDVKILTNTKVVSAAAKNGYISLKTEGGVSEVTADCLLIATGRKPNTEGLSLEKAGVEYSSKGVKVDKYLRTTAKNIFAAGDIVSPYQFTHAADYEAVTAARNALLPFKKKTDYSDMGWCTYTEPELARCGLTEAEASEKYGKNSIRVFRYSYQHVDRAAAEGKMNGLAKYVTDRKGKLLGIHILGERAGEIIHEPMLAKKFNIPFQKIADMIHIYPTYSYAVRQPAKYAAVKMLLDNPFIKFLRRLKK